MFLHQICLLAFAAVVAAQIPGLPQCAQACASSLPKECKSLDFRCICSSQDWITNISCCVSKSCTVEEQKGTIKFATDLCKAQNVDLPQAAACSESGSSSITSASSPTSSSSSSAGSAASGSVASGSITSGITKSSSQTATTTGPPASQTNSAQSSGSAGAAAATGAAVHVIGPGVAFAGVAVAALALL